MVSKNVQINVIGDASSATRALDGVATKSTESANKSSGAFKALGGMLASTNIFGPITEGFEKVAQGFDHMKEHGKSVSSALVGGGMGLAGVGGMLTALGDKEKQAGNQLRQAIENTGGSYEDFAGKIEKNIKSNEKFGHSSKDTTEAIRILTQATNSTDKALGDMGVAADLAAAKHISLSDAASLLAKVHGGSAKVLKAFGIDVEKASDNTKAMTAEQKLAAVADTALAKSKENLAMLHERLAGKTKLTVSETQSLTRAQEAVKTSSDKASEAHKKLASMHQEVTTKAGAATDNIAKLGAKLDGQAAAAADTFGGKLKALKTELEDGAAKMGAKYGPALTGLGAGMTLLGGVTKGAQSVLGLFAGAQAVATTATEAQTAANIVETPTMWAALGPVLLIIAAIALLALGIYELVTHWKVVWGAIKDVVSGAWDGIKSIFTTVIDWIKHNWQVILGILTAPFGGAFLLIWHFRDQIIDVIGKIPSMIGNILKSIYDIITWPFKTSFNQIAWLWNNTVGSLSFKIPSWIPVIGGDSFSMPKLPTLAQGGVALGPTLALIGESGPEAVVPLGSAAAANAGFGGGGGLTVTVPLAVDGRQFAVATARFTRDELIKMRRSNPVGPSL